MESRPRTSRQSLTPPSQHVASFPVLPPCYALLAWRGHTVALPTFSWGYRGEPTGMMTRHHLATSTRNGRRRNPGSRIGERSREWFRGDIRRSRYQGGRTRRVLPCRDPRVRLTLRCARGRAGKVASWGPGDETSGKSRQIRRTEVEEPANPECRASIETRECIFRVAPRKCRLRYYATEYRNNAKTWGYDSFYYYGIIFHSVCETALRHALP